MYTRPDVANETETLPPVEPIETMDGELTLRRRLGEDEPRAWALAWCEAGLMPRRSARAGLDVTSTVAV